MTPTPEELEKLELAEEQRRSNTPFWRAMRWVVVVMLAIVVYLVLVQR